MFDAPVYVVSGNVIVLSVRLDVRVCDCRHVCLPLPRVVFVQTLRLRLCRLFFLGARVPPLTLVGD